MQHRTLGSSGFSVSEIGLGCWQLGGDFGPVEDERAEAIMAAADEAGIDFWDTADVYGAGLSEERIGAYTAAHPGERTIVTKVGRNGELYPDGYTKRGVRSSLEGSARRLGGEALDLAQLHCVPTDVLRAGDILAWMEEFQDDGLIKHFGASVETIEEAHLAMAHPKLVSIQTIFNIFRQDHITELFPAATDADVGIIVRLPLASGVLSGKMTKDHTFAETDHRNYNADGAFFSVGETFSGVPFPTAVEFAQAVEQIKPAAVSMVQLALRWILDQPAVSTIIAGVSKPQQVAQNASASALEPLGAEIHEQLSAFYFDTVKPTIRGVM